MPHNFFNKAKFFKIIRIFELIFLVTLILFWIFIIMPDNSYFDDIIIPDFRLEEFWCPEEGCYV